MKLICFLAATALIVSAQTPQPGQLATVSAPPLTVAQKFGFSVIQDFTIRGLIGNGIGAAIGEWAGVPHEWGQGFGGYSKRFASGFAQTLTRETVAWGIDSAAHIDPRYFPSSESGAKARLLNAVKQIYLARRDDGGTSFAYGRVISAFTAGEVVNAWQPPSTRGVGHGIERGCITLGVDGAENLAQEIFVFARPRSLRHRH